MLQYRPRADSYVHICAHQEDEVLFTLPRHILLNTRTSVLPEVCARVSPQLGTDAPSSEKMKGWKDLGTGWASLILCMMWERWRTGEGRAAWGAFNSARDAPWTRAAEAHSADADAMEGVETSEGSAGEEKREQARTGERPRGEQEWGEYFDLLPTEFGTPMFWEAKDLAELEGTNVLGESCAISACVCSLFHAESPHSLQTRPGKVGRADADADYHNLLVPFIAAHEQIFFGTDLQGSFDERVQKHYSLQLYHQMGSRILSRSFHVKKPSAPGALEDTAVGEEDEESDSDEEEEYEDVRVSFSFPPLLVCAHSYLTYLVHTGRARGRRRRIDGADGRFPKRPFRSRQRKQPIRRWSEDVPWSEWSHRCVRCARTGGKSWARGAGTCRGWLTPGRKGR